MISRFRRRTALLRTVPATWRRCLLAGTVLWTVLHPLPLAGLALEKAEAPVRPRYDDTIRHYGSADGLPQNSVNAIVQSDDGYLWLGTYGGLTRFDGTRFTLFRRLAQQGPSSDRILSVMEDPRKRLWIGTEDAGINVLEDGRFARLRVCEERCQTGGLLLAETRILAATNVGLFAIGVDDRSARRIGPELSLDFAVTHAGKQFVAGPSGIWQVDGDALRALAGPAGTEWTRPTVLTVVDGALVLGLANDLYRFGEDGWHVFAAGKSLPGISVAVRDPAGRLWVSDIAGRTQRQIDGVWHEARDDGETGASGAVGAIGSSGAIGAIGASDLGSVHSQWVDREGNLWLGSNGRGLFRVRPARVALLNDRRARFDLPGLPIASHGRDGMWFGLLCDGLRYLDSLGSVRSWPTLGDLTGSCAWSFQGTADGGLFLGTSDGKLGFLPGPDAEIRKLASWPSKGIVRTIFPLDATTLWVAVGAQTVRVSLNAERRVVAEHEETALAGLRVQWISPAGRGGHWFAGDQGVVRLVAGEVRERWGVAEGLSSRFARTVFEESDGTLWIGTYGGGLNVVRDGRVSVYNEANGLFDDVASCILEDRAGRLWLSGNRGISMIARDERARAGREDSMTSLGFAAEDGLLPVETNGGSQSACLVDESGHLWFPLVSGFARIDPDRAIAGNPIVATPTIESVRVDGQSMHFDGGLKLESSARNLEIHYSAPSLTTPDQTRFRFRWTGDPEWTETGAQRSLYYPLIPWGVLQLQIAFRVGSGPWSEKPARLDIFHPTPWHQRPFVWSATLVVAAILILSGRRGFGWYLRRRAEREARPILARADQLERDNEVLSDQARRDGLTGVANRRHFDLQLTEVASRRALSPTPVSLLLIDIDEFKRFNDHFGHIAGDDCLRAVAGAMQGAVTEPFLLARYGGEEFAVLMPGADAGQAHALARQLSQSIAGLELPQAPGAQHLQVTLSIGIATQRAGHVGRLSDLIASADSAMYRAKRDGRDRIEENRDT
ncbi:MAG: diguanylate cyclase [Thermoanaerobaculia bacterium]